MAVDTRDKRASAVGFVLTSRLAPPLPDGSFNQADRQHIAYSYRGILATAPSTDVFSGYTIRDRNPRRTITDKNPRRTIRGQ